MAIFKNTEINDTGFLELPAGNTSQRPSSPQIGMLRFNTDLQIAELYNGTEWVALFAEPISASGGSVSQISQGGDLYQVHTFNSNDTFSVSSLGSSDGTVEYLVLAGGGTGGNNKAGSFENGGGGGAGGLLTGSTTVSPTNYSVSVGAGANIPGSNGQRRGENSSVFSATATGGGGGCTRDSNTNVNGGSGGGACNNSPQTGQGSGIPGQGNPGARAFNTASTNGGSGGGGGAGNAGGTSSGNTGGAGGNGITSSIAGNAVTYAGGGGAGGANGGPGGSGGGGDGNISTGSPNGFDGQDGRGGGGGGNFATSGNAGNGGNGVVIIRYKL